MSKLIEADLSFEKIFITGVYRSGKSTIAKQIQHHTSYPYKNFDALWNYSMYRKPDGARQYAMSVLQRIGSKFVIDAIPFDLPPYFYSSFDEFYEQHSNEILIICAICPSIETWLSRLSSTRKITPASAQHHVGSYIDFHTSLLPAHDAKNILYYDTISEQYISRLSVVDLLTDITEQRNGTD